MHFFAKRFKGKGEYLELLKGYGYSRIFSWIIIIALLPYMGQIFQIYSLVISYFLVKRMYNLKKLDALLVILISAGIFMLLFKGYIMITGEAYRGFII